LTIEGFAKMKTQKLLIVSLVIATGVAIAGLIIIRQKTDRVVEPVRVAQTTMPATPALSESTPPPEMPAAEPQPKTQPPLARVPAKANPQKIPVPANQPAPAARQKEPIQDPTARAALSSVGADRDAEAYWMSAINDPSLSAHERQDLIEDLNEDGLSDPHHPGPGDMPLILSRIRLIEELAPSAMDQVNAEAFAEAYKDLVNLASGRPVD
jgi:hypothetical protein